MATDPIRIPIIAEDKASAELRKVSKSADQLDKKKVSVAVDTGKSQGMIGKLQGAIGNIGPMVGTAAAAVGTIGAAVGAMVGKWQGLALEVGHFRDATGVSADSASRFVELAKDMGLEVGTVESMIGKLNKTAGASPEVFADLGVEIARTADGATDVQQTFLNAVEAVSSIKDPAQQAMVAAKLFGKSWQSAAEPVTGGADDVKKKLDSLKGSKLVDDREIAKAKEVRDNFDAMHDSVEELSNIIGQRLAPALGDAAAQAAKLGEIGGPILTGIIEGSVKQLELGTAQIRTMGHVAEGVGHAVGGAIDSIFGHKDATDKSAESTIKLTGAQQLNAIAADMQRDAMKGAAAEVEHITSASDLATGAFDRMRGALNMKTAAEKLAESVAGAVLKVGSGATLSKEEIASIEDQILTTGQMAGDNPINVASTIDKLEAGDLSAVWSSAQGYMNNAGPVSITVQARLQAGEDVRRLISGGGMGSGNQTMMPVPAAAAVAPVAVAPIGSTHTVPLTVAVPNVKITVNAGMVTDTAGLLRALTRSNKAADRMLGVGWRSV